MKMMVKMKMMMMKKMEKKIIRNDIILDREKLLFTTRLHWKVSAIFFPGDVIILSVSLLPFLFYYFFSLYFA